MTVSAQREPGGRTDAEVDALFASLVTDGAAPGVCYGVVDRTGLVQAAGHGVARVGGPPPDPATAFRIASMTKSFTAASVMVLIERGALSLADPVSRHVPEFGAVRPPTSDSPDITVGMLASMSGGLPTDDAWADRQESMSRDAFARLLSGGVRFVGTPGTGFEYSNLGFAVLGRVIEAVSQMTYHAFVEEYLIRPLGLTSTGYDTSVAAPGGVAAGHVRLDGRWRPEPFSGPGVFSAIGGLFSTVEDIARWVTWLAGAFPARDGADPGPLSRAARRDMQQVHRAVPPAPTATGEQTEPITMGYGYGLGIQHDPVWGTVVYHSGGYPGFGSHMRWHPATGMGVIAMTNARYVTGRAQATTALRTVLARTTGTTAGGGATVGGETGRDGLWPETVQARQAVERLLRGWDTGVAETWFADNVAMDLDLEHRRAHIGGLVQAAGPLREPAPDTLVRSDSPAHVVWEVRGARGVLRCEIRLNPQDPPKIQTLTVEEASPDAECF